MVCKFSSYKPVFLWVNSYLHLSIGQRIKTVYTGRIGNYNIVIVLPKEFHSFEMIPMIKRRLPKKIAFL